MNNVNLSLALTSALSLLRNTSISDTIRDEIQRAIESGLSRCDNDLKPTTLYMNLTLRSVPFAEKIRCIAAVKNVLMWNLKDSKDFVDVVLGKLVSAGVYKGGTPNTLTDTTERVRELAAKLSQLGCEVFPWAPSREGYTARHL
jgi:ribosomal protein L7/L12